MKRVMFLSVWSVLSVLVLSQLSFAQLIDHSRRNRGATGGGYPSPAPAQPATAPTPEPESVSPAPMMQESQPVAEVMPGDFKVTNEVEEVYDLSKDGSLQPEEIKEFLKDVSSAVDKKGSFMISSELLRGYDENSDGMISRDELSEIEAAIAG